MERYLVKQYDQLFLRFAKLKKKYDEMPDDSKSKMQEDIINTLESGFTDLKKAVMENNSNRVMELSLLIKVFLQGFKLTSNQKVRDK